VAANGEVNLTILDSGSATILVPGANVQAAIGVCSGGVVNQVVATTNATTVQSVLGYGPLPEYCGLAVKAGATVLAVKATQNAAGTASSIWTPLTNLGTSPLTVTLDPVVGAFDDYYVIVKIIASGTRGTSGWTFQVSLDAGRNFGPTINPGTATSYVIPNTGITLNFGAGTLNAGDLYEFSTTAPSANTAGISSALTALQNSPYALTGWGSLHILGVWTGADATTIEGYLDTFASPGYIFTRAMLTARDVSPASKWGGSAESEAAWMTQLQNSYSATSAKRINAGTGYYNIPSAYPGAIIGAPRYRRPGQWAAAVRKVGAPPQRHIGRVLDGALASIVVDPANDPSDGFVYHDERLNPGMDAARFESFRTRVGQPAGYFVTNPNLMSPLGSDFSMQMFGDVMDVACLIVHQVGTTIINQDIRLNTSGTIYENEARAIEAIILNAINAAMTANNMISSAKVVVDRASNVAVLKQVNIAITIYARGYVLGENVVIGFSNPLAAQ
jgi:hypothetical protein